MSLQNIINNYLNVKFNLELDNISKDVQYFECEDGTHEIFFENTDDMFILWNSNLTLDGTHYVDIDPYANSLGLFKNIDIYDEELLNNMVFTIDSILSIKVINKYNNINDFFKNYCFFQLSLIDKNLKEFSELRDFLFFYFMYFHPTNEETRDSFNFHNGKIYFSPKKINLKEYVSKYYEYYIENYKKYISKIDISKDSLLKSKKISLSLIDAIESNKKIKISVSHDLIKYINNYQLFIDLHNNQIKDFLDKIKKILHTNNVNCSYLNLFFINNYVIYILFFDINKIKNLIVDLGEESSNKLFKDYFNDNLIFRRVYNKNKNKIKNDVLNEILKYYK